MDSPRGASVAVPPSISEIHCTRSRRASSSKFQPSSISGRTTIGMAIPGICVADTPPALPPPRYITGLDEGVDLAWNYQNEFHSDASRLLAPIKAGSSLLGAQMAQLVRDSDDDIEMDLEPVSDSTHIQYGRSDVRTTSKSPFSQRPAMNVTVETTPSGSSQE